MLSFGSCLPSMCGSLEFGALEFGTLEFGTMWVAIV